MRGPKWVESPIQLSKIDHHDRALEIMIMNDKKGYFFTFCGVKSKSCQLLSWDDASRSCVSF